MANFKSFSTAATVLAMYVGLSAAQAASDSSVKHNMPMGSSMNMGQMNSDNMNNGQVKSDQAVMKMPKITGAIPKEPGQGAFATIAEIVIMLTNDPKTDWSKVDFNRLREHLVDMDEVTLRATAKTAVYDDRIEFTVSGNGRTKQAIQAMIPAHAGVLSQITGWNAKGETIDSGALLTVYSDDPATLVMIKGLGFFGVLATGVHHQPHHLAMAKGG